MQPLDILIPTCNRAAALAIRPATLTAQRFGGSFRRSIAAKMFSPSCA